MAERYAAAMALLAFAALCTRGALAGEAFTTVIPRALVAMVILGGVGYAIGLLARHAVRESVEREIRAQEQAPAGPADTDAPGPDRPPPEPPRTRAEAPRRRPPM